MKKIIAIYVFCVIGMFFVPIMLVNENCLDKSRSKSLCENNISVKLLNTNTGKIDELSLDEYIMGVIIGEMPVAYELEALKSQAIVARTYTLNKILKSPNAHVGADMCDDINHCQAYKSKEYAFSCWGNNDETQKWNKIKKAVEDTKNMVITYEGELINAFFHANSGGRTENIANIWGHESIPYLVSKESSEDVLLDAVTFSYSDINSLMKEKYLDYELLDAKNMEGKIKVLETNSSGRVSKMQISNIIINGNEARTIFDLRSTMIDVEQENEYITFKTRGYGHGVGMSQDGANYMASKGASYKDIILHY